jgi:hypothetical protein
MKMRNREKTLVLGRGSPDLYFMRVLKGLIYQRTSAQISGKKLFSLAI